MYWDEVQIGVTESTVVNSANGTGNGGQSGFDIAYQAMIIADTVQNEDLSGGQFAGVLGLARELDVTKHYRLDHQPTSCAIQCRQIRSSHRKYLDPQLVSPMARLSSIISCES